MTPLIVSHHRHPARRNHPGRQRPRGDFLDSYTNLLNCIPDAEVSDVRAGIITVAKQLAVGAVKGLSGLQSMRPGGEFGTWLNTGPKSGETRSSRRPTI
jgi:hypothetical protein